MGYLTPNSIPTDTICRVLFIPNNDEFLANVTGALQVLTIPESWTPYGLLTPEQSANALVDMFDQFCFNQGVCRVVGEYIDYAGTVSPDPKWLVCDGASLSRADYPDLFLVIGTIYGSVDSAHFNLPDHRGRTRVGAGHGSGLSNRSVGDSFGEETHQLTVSELALHTHTDTGHVHSEGTAAPNVTTIGPGSPEPTAIPSVGITGSANANLTNTGSDQPHNNMQPSIVGTVLIVALP